MGLTHNFTLMYQRDGGEPVKHTVSLSQDAETNLDVTVPAETDDHQVAVEIDVSAMESIYLVSDKDVTIETNLNDFPDDTLNLKANEPVVWWAGNPLANPFTSGTDVTTLFISNQNGGGVTANVKMRLLQNPTP